MFGKLFGFGKSSSANALPKGKRTNLEKRYTKIAETASQGSMAAVYKATDNETGKTVCLKVQDAEKTAAALARAASRQSEGEIAKLVVHPHVVKTYDFGYSTKGEYFIAMEFVDGHTLTTVRKSQPLDLTAKVELLAQGAEAIAAVHAAGFIHRDIGPNNLIVNRSQQVKLIDFGLAVPNIDAFKRPGNRTGTLDYMAPELVRREETDERIDNFAFGVTAFEFLTGRMPYDANPKDRMAVMRSRMNNEPASLETVDPTLPQDLCKLIDKLLAKDPKNRWAKMSMLPDSLRGISVPVSRSR